MRIFFLRKKKQRTNKMLKLFQSARNSFATLGICPIQSYQKYPLNGEGLMVYFGYWVGTIFFCVFLSRNAHNLEEYSDLFFRISLLFLIIACYTITIFKLEFFFQILGMCEEIISNSELTTFNRWHRLFFEKIVRFEIF